MPRYKFAWTNLPQKLLKQLAGPLGLDLVDPALALRPEYANRPDEEFVRLARPVLQEPGLARDPAALEAVVMRLWLPTIRGGCLLPSGRQRQREWPTSRKSTARVCNAANEPPESHGRRNSAVVALAPSVKAKGSIVGRRDIRAASMLACGRGPLFHSGRSHSFANRLTLR
jgi:hypothetical protein